ncbi:MAG: hypothetical protein KAR35_01000 [Candidatus Heimdallarchaeota archaeon]|nr:hypothetical protein [Candidatus Heimdallarchaeota archaeon]MCK5047931.1 hypothetical protein [Candidatus Heimdallarchaeota archaeon]
MEFKRFIPIPIALITIWLTLMMILGVISLFIVPLETDYSRIVQISIGALQLFVTILMISTWLFVWYKTTIWLMNFYLKEPVTIDENDDK